jgi:hypothetical protein
MDSDKTLRVLMTCRGGRRHNFDRDERNGEMLMVLSELSVKDSEAVCLQGTCCTVLRV